MSVGKRVSFCGGGSTVVPCTQNAWVRIHPFGQLEAAVLACGRHYASVSRGLFAQYGSMIIVERMGE